MKPTRWPTVLTLVLVTGVVGWLLPELFYKDLVALPRAAAVTAGLIAVFELGLARVVSRAIRGVRVGRPLHPLQVARAAALGKASALTGALLTGFYGGFFLWTLQNNRLRAARHDAWVSAWSAAACLLLLLAGLLLERSCRTPRPRDEMPTWTSTS